MGRTTTVMAVGAEGCRAPERAQGGTQVGTGTSRDNAGGTGRKPRSGVITRGDIRRMGILLGTRPRYNVRDTYLHGDGGYRRAATWVIGTYDANGVLWVRISVRCSTPTASYLAGKYTHATGARHVAAWVEADTYYVAGALGTTWEVSDVRFSAPAPRLNLFND